MSREGISALERGIRRVPYRDTVALLAEGLQLSATDRARLEAAAARAAQPRRRRSAVTPDAAEDRGLHNLPFGTTRLVGRHVDVAEIVTRVREAPLVTIVGAGGVGKTRIALQVGVELANGIDGGAWFVDLAALSNTSSIDRAIIRTLGSEETPNKPALEALLAYLARKALVLILDNCEHVIANAADVAGEIIRACPNVRIVATSREPLKIPGEHVYRLRPLPTPTLADARRLTASEALGYGAIALFAERAQAVDHLFVLADENAPTVAAICRRLEGLPLAIELAAARVGTLTLKTLLERLDDRLAILTGGVRKTLPRQQTMRALIDWSYDLLSPPEKHVFDAFSIFRGGCTLGIATSVVGHDVAGNDILDLLASLVDKSLLAVDLSGDEPRYALPESSFHYAQEKLVARQEWNALAHRHARAYLHLAEQLERASYTGGGTLWSTAIEAELTNWRAALEWTLLEQGDVTLGMRLAGALRPVWATVAFAEGRSWVRKAFELLETTTTPEITARLEHAAARIALRFAESQVAVDIGERALVRYRALGDRRAVADVQRVIGHSLLILRRNTEAERILLEALETARQLGCRWLAGFIIQSLAYARSLAGDLATSQAYYAEADRTFREVGDESSAAICTGNLAEAEYHAGNAVKALQMASDALTRYRRQDRIQTFALANMAAYLIALGRFDEARRRAVEALELAREQRQDVALAWAMQHLAAVAALRQDDEVETSPTRHARAARLLGYVDARLAALGAPRQFTEQQEYLRVLEALTRTFDQDALATRMAYGSTMTEESAINEALSA